jgi:tetratricopeptide (TPR) repeat protein
MTPNLPEAYINDSAALIYMGQHQDAVMAINHAIELGTKKMPEALYNRSMAYHHLKEYGKAYKDLKHALLLRPDWAPALLSLEKYDVVSAPSK